MGRINHSAISFEKKKQAYDLDLEAWLSSIYCTKDDVKYIYWKNGKLIRKRYVIFEKDIIELPDYLQSINRYADYKKYNWQID